MLDRVSPKSMPMSNLMRSNEVWKVCKNFKNLLMIRASVMNSKRLMAHVARI
jgi:hypothetical protein